MLAAACFDRTAHASLRTPTHTVVPVNSAGSRGGQMALPNLDNPTDVRRAAVTRRTSTARKWYRSTHNKQRIGPGRTTQHGELRDDPLLAALFRVGPGRRNDLSGPGT
ncbi:hypothetical protein GCM10027615_67350 [Plantactinospora veratri]